MQKSKGFSYIEVMVSLVIIVIVMDIFFMAMMYTSKSYQSFRETEEATLYGKEVLQYMTALIEKGEEIESEVLKDYKKSQSSAVQNYQYHCMILPEIPEESTLQLGQLERGLQFTTEESFDFEIFKKLYETEQLTFRRPVYKAPEESYYEGLSLKSTKNRLLVVGQDQITEKGSPLITMQVNVGGDKACIQINSCSEAVDPHKRIFVLWEDVENLKDKSLDVEWMNHTPCQVIVGMVGTSDRLEGINFNAKEGSQSLMIKRLSEKPSREQRYVVLEAVTKRVEEGYKVLKTYVAIQ